MWVTLGKQTVQMVGEIHMHIREQSLLTNSLAHSEYQWIYFSSEMETIINKVEQVSD